MIEVIMCLCVIVMVVSSGWFCILMHYWASDIANEDEGQPERSAE